MNEALKALKSARATAFEYRAAQQGVKDQAETDAEKAQNEIDRMTTRIAELDEATLALGGEVEE